MRAEVALVLAPLENAVGPLRQRDICWLMLYVLDAVDNDPDARMEPPEWAHRPEVPGAAVGLLVVVTAFGTALRNHGVKFDPHGLSDRVALAELLTLQIPWHLSTGELVDWLRLGSLKLLRG
jgi:hypothetical protein